MYNKMSLFNISMYDEKLILQNFYHTESVILSFLQQPTMVEQLEIARA